MAPRPIDYALHTGAVEPLLAPAPGTRLLVTPNVDHLRLLSISASLRRAYREADVVINDSRLLDRLVFRGKVACYPGSDLAPERLKLLPAGTSVAIIGYTPKVKSFLEENFDLRLTFIEPPMGYIRQRRERRLIVEQLARVSPDQIFICTGAPQSELMAAQIKRAGVGGDILCCGSALRFVAGEVDPAPSWVRQQGAEWLWRFVTESRTRKRYFADLIFLGSNLGNFIRLRAKGRASFGAFSLSSQ